MKLQIALDDISMEAAMELLGKVKEYADIAEVGTPFLMEYGWKQCAGSMPNFRGCRYSVTERSWTPEAMKQSLLSGQGRLCDGAGCDR